MNCHLCSAKISIKTDPGNMDYVIVEGARRVEQRWDPTQNGQIVPDDKRYEENSYSMTMNDYV